MRMAAVPEKKADTAGASSADELTANLVRAANSLLNAELPTGKDWAYLTATSPAFSAATATLARQAKALLQRFRGWPADDNAGVAAGLTDVVDAHLDRVEDSLGELTGRSAPVDALRPAAKRARTKAPGVAVKPQVNFPVPVDNHAPFVPPPPVGVPDGLLGRLTLDGATHPMADIIREFPSTVWALALRPPVPPRAMVETPCTWVDTPEKLDAMVDVLAKQEAIAVDLEAHDLRSFQGFVCLMQISTRTEDFLVDTLALRGSIGAALGSIFHDPRIIKVMHGADHDVIWLQRDFALYLAGLFDTKQASELCGNTSHSLAHLLQLFCGVSANKHYQLADWRMRPLGEGMAFYARSDTHHLLYIWDTLRHQLATCPPPAPPPSEADDDSEVDAMMYPSTPPELGALPAAWSRSALVALKTYTNSPLSSDAHIRVAKRVGVPLSARSRAVLRALVVWRDGVARAADEGIGYVMPNRLIVRLADAAPEAAPEVAAFLRELAWASDQAEVARTADHLVALIRRSKLDFQAAEEEERRMLDEKQQEKARKAARHRQRSPSPQAAAPPQVPLGGLEADGRPAKQRRRIAVTVAPVEASALGAALGGADAGE